MTAGLPTALPYELSDVELVGGMVFGSDPSRAPLPRLPADPRAPRKALEEALLSALKRPPCLVSFSGGRDSSAMLAVAVHVARREGLPLPVPATLRVTGSSGAEESDWQELVVKHLGVEDWFKFEVTDELDAVGPVAQTAMSRHGLLWPFNTHFHLPIFQQAAGGAVVTGFGGDELGISTATVNAERLIASRRVRRRSDVLVLGLALSPGTVKRIVHGRRGRQNLASRKWLTPEGVRRVAVEAAASEAALPLGWHRILDRAIWRGRFFLTCKASLALAASTSDTTVVHPFVDGEVLAALAGVGGFAGLGNRTSLLQLLFGDLLPAETVQRASKAHFDDAIWTGRARRFAADWSGEGLPSELLDVPALREEWQSEVPHALTATLLQAAWLHDHPADQHRPGRAPEPALAPAESPSHPEAGPSQHP